MREFTAEDFQEVSHVPRRPVHVVVNLTLADRGRLAVDDDLLDDETHPGKPLAARRVFPNRLLVDFVDSENLIKKYVQ